MATAAIHHLHDAIEQSADPALARVGLERLGDSHPGLVERLVADSGLAETVIAVLVASRSLTRLLESDAEAVEVLADLDRRLPAPSPGEGEDALARWKSLELLRIAGRDLTGGDDLSSTARALSDLADDVLAGAVALADGEVVVVGMGKLGGQELNYASDIDVMFVVGDDADHDEAEAVARQVMSTARRCFRVDANLRPEGRDGPLVRSVSSYRAYWDRWAKPWEFQALLKARPVAGPPDVAADWEGAATERLWGRTFPSDDLRSLRSLKARAEAEVERRGLAGRELKRGAGGIRDIEFAVQLLQLVHGRHDQPLRSPNTLAALEELATAGYVDRADADELAGAYRFLRTVEHRLQLVDEQQVHTVPAADDQRERLARVLGFRGSPESTALGAFDAELASVRASVRSIHERIWFRPLLEAFSGVPGRLTEEAAEARLAAFGFTDADRTRQAVRELTSGLTRASRLMEQLLPLLLGWLADSPDPDRGLLGLRNLATGIQRSAEMARAFRESPEAARRLCLVLGASPLLAATLNHNPDLVPELGDDRALAPRSASKLLEKATTALTWRDADSRHARLKRFKEREILRIATRDLVLGAAVDATATDLTNLADATVQGALASIAPQVPFAVIAMGRFGGAEMSYASDLDVVFVHEGGEASDHSEAERAASDLMRVIKGGVPADRIYLVDADLRPEGKQGPLSRSIDGWCAYLERWAQVWERQALIRARPVAGDSDLAERFCEAIEPYVWGRPLTMAEAREIRRIKARVERERIPAGQDPQFHLKLGRGSLSDIEFCVQLLQLQHGVTGAGTMEALARLARANVVDPADTEVLAEAYRFCERTRNRLFLVQGSAGDSLPQAPEALGRLARSLDTSPAELREEYRRVTRRSRSAVERLFYGRR